MDILNFCIYAAWLLSEILINRLTRSKSGNVDANSLRLIWLTVVISVTLAVLADAYFYLPVIPGNTCYFLGTAMMIIGIIARIIAVRSLGRMFTAEVTIRTNHTLKTDGLYRRVRHPSYTFSLMTFWGFALSLNNWASLLLVVLPVTAAFSYRVRIEERALLAHFGSAYEDYRSRTKKFIPFIY